MFYIYTSTSQQQRKMINIFNTIFFIYNYAKKQEICANVCLCANNTWFIKAPDNLLPLLYNTGIWSVVSLALLLTPIKSGLPRLQIYNNILTLQDLHIQ